MSFSDAQRLAFGTVAEHYDRHRPGYPPQAIERVLREAGLRSGDEVLEIGAGTGKLTLALIAHGLRVTAIEPSAEMAAVARARLADAHTPADAVRFVAADFERFTASRRYDGVLCAAAWHWLDPESRYRLARAALRPGATLALIWSFADWRHCTLRAPLAAAYRAAVPDLEPRFSMHPDTPPARLVGDLVADARRDGGYVDPRTVEIPWTLMFTTAEYLATLATHQDHILLDDEVRERLFTAIAAVLDDDGGRIELPMLCRLGLATAA